MLHVAQRVKQRASQRPAAARCAVERSDEYLCTGGLTVDIE